MEEMRFVAARVLKDLKGPKVFRDQLEQWEELDLRVQQDQPDLKAHQEQRDFREQQDLKVFQAQRERRGPQGPAGGILDFADFYALMPGDNGATVAIGGNVEFPQDGPSSGSGAIFRIGPDTFNLSEIGVYQVLFQVSVTQAGQLVLTLDTGSGSVELPYTVVGRATGTSQIVGMALVQTSVVNSVLTVSNPLANPTALAITPLAGGADPISAHLIITRIQ